ncbi:hypothetical protein PG985_011381 [Apiospora marii]|uniref:Uncharacterized protein n=1 Tax=Apiospora marii TaxID=335849 RepID=A0ABR1STH5_9PEZI
MHGILSLWKGNQPPVSGDGEPSGDGPQDENDRGPYVLAPGGASDEGIGIIFVHGRRGSLLGTWSCQSGLCWPRDLLAKDDSRHQESSSWGLSGFAENLLTDLASLRVVVVTQLTALIGRINRPIVFIAHILGILVIKEALIAADNSLSHGRLPDQEEVYSSTKGVISFGMPHRCSDESALGEMLWRTPKISLRQPKTQLLAVLRQDSHILEKQRDEFTTRIKDMDILCFTETTATSIGMIFPAASAVYDGFSVQSASAEATT